MKKIDKLTLSVLSLLLLVVFVLVPFHAPLSVYFGQFFSPDIVKAWKEIFLIVAIPFALYIVFSKKLFRTLIKDTLVQLIMVFVGLHVLLALVLEGDAYQKIAGLLIDLRFVAFFLLTYSLVIAHPKLKQHFLKALFVTACLSMGFALLQATVLPKDVLAHIGYGSSTIEPYLTVDKNNEFVRINGTMRGPNPLGAYAVVLLSLLVAMVVKKKREMYQNKWLISGASIILLTVLWASYSRSAMLGLLASLVTVVLVMSKKITTKQATTTLVALAVIFIAGYLVKDSYLVQNIVLHNNPQTGSQIDSNDDHVLSLQDGLIRMLRQPYGAGIGSTGSASLRSDEPLIIENYYLFVAHETGWFGFGLFIAIYMLILGRLYKNRRDWLCLGMFASGIGIAVIGLLLPVWTDDAISLIWFGLAGVALGSHKIKVNKSVKKTK